MLTQIPIDKIKRDFSLDQLDAQALQQITDSIRRIGLQQPIVVSRAADLNDLIAGLYDLIGGRHRVAAMMELGYEDIAAIILEGDQIDLEMAQIALDLHRRDLSKVQKSVMYGRWLELEKLRAARAVSPGGRGNEGGLRAAARALGLPESTARDLVMVAKLTPEAREVAVELGVDNHSGILKTAATEPPANQPKRIREEAAKRGKSDKTVVLNAANCIAELVRDHLPASQWASFIELVRTTKINALLCAFEKLLVEHDGDSQATD